jgi:hypothetical protein
VPFSPSREGVLAKEATPYLKELHQVAIGITDEERAGAEVEGIVRRGHDSGVALEVRLKRCQSVPQKQNQDVVKRGDLQGDRSGSLPPGPSRRSALAARPRGGARPQVGQLRWAAGRV